MGDLTAVLAIVFLSTLVQSTFSFGGALVALPLLALVVDIKTATPLMTLLSCSIACLVTTRRWRDIQVGNAWRIIVSACLGIPLGILYRNHRPILEERIPVIQQTPLVKQQFDILHIEKTLKEFY